MFFNWLAGSNAPAWVAQAKSRPLLESIGTSIENMLPEDPENAILKRLNKNAPVAGPDTDGGAATDSGDAASPDDEAPSGNAPANN